MHGQPRPAQAQTMRASWQRSTAAHDCHARPLGRARAQALVARSCPCAAVASPPFQPAPLTPTPLFHPASVSQPCLQAGPWHLRPPLPCTPPGPHLHLLRLPEGDPGGDVVQQLLHALGARDHAQLRPGQGQGGATGSLCKNECSSTGQVPPLCFRPCRRTASKGCGLARRSAAQAPL